MLRLEGIRKRYPGGVQALKGISLDIPKGLFGLLGPNGAGKSTLMRILATLLAPDAGTIELDGIDGLREPEQLRRQLGYLPQDFGVYPRVSAQALLNHIAELKGITRGRERHRQVEWALAQTNLSAVRKRPVAAFSGGMRQRFGIAQALLGEPRLIIVDEPTAGLDPAERQRFHNLLAEIGRDIVVILSTHIVEDVANLCANTAIIAAGEIVAKGDPRQLVEGLRGRLWSFEVAPEQLAEVCEAHEVISSHWRQGRRVVHVESETKPSEKFEPVQPTLEDLYFSLVRDGGQREDAA